MTRKRHARNERIKRKYCIWLKDAKQMSERTVDQALAAIVLFEKATGGKDFAAFHIEQVRAFKRRLVDDPNPKTGKPYAVATIKGRLDAAKAFFLWLADQPGYRSRIRYADCEYFNISANDTRIATAKRIRPAPELEQVQRVLDAMPSGTDIQMRDRAIIAFALVTGVRDDALASLSVRHVDVAAPNVFQDARTVRTKYRKSRTTTFFQVGGNAETIVLDWITYLVEELRFSPDDPLFPQTDIGLDDNGRFAAIGLKRAHWKNADAIRRVFKEAFERGGLPPYNPHSIRTTLGRYGERVCR
jgi:integrase